MKKVIVILLLSLITYFLFLRSAYAIVDPLSAPNNRFGIHILFPDELSQAAQLVNSNNGEWGYITIPIQAGDRDMEKWQEFMDLCKEYKIIPILRLATEGDYFNTKVWRKPTAEDVLDFANFLNSLVWPTKNRYIIVFNEVNRSDEWGGATSPEEYVRILNYAIDAFKTKNEDFFIIASGMDNASVTVIGSSYNEFSFFQIMEHEVPGIFSRIDGISSHSYPNPAFSQPPSKQDYSSIASFRHESDFIAQFTTKKLPVFITETGWSKQKVPESVIASYLQEAFVSVWNTDNIVAVTPFLLHSGGGAFVEFSYTKPDGSPGEEFTTLKKLPKIKGNPVRIPNVLGTQSVIRPPYTTKNFSKESVGSQEGKIELSPTLKYLFKWLLRW